MSARSGKLQLGFEEASLCLDLASIQPLREVPRSVRNSAKYRQIAASIEEIGLVEPPVVARDAADEDRYHLLDGHLRLAILRDRGDSEVVCLVATDDEAFTYNKHISRIATIQEHKMILNAIKKGVTEERLARALNVNIASIRNKRRLLSGICQEVADLLRDRHVPINTFTELRFLKPLRQIEVAQVMIAMNRFNAGYVRSLMAATPRDQLVEDRPGLERGANCGDAGRVRESRSRAAPCRAKLQHRSSRSGPGDWVHQLSARKRADRAPSCAKPRRDPVRVSQDRRAREGRLNAVPRRLWLLKLSFSPRSNLPGPDAPQGRHVDACRTSR